MNKQTIARILHTYFLRLKKYYTVIEKKTSAETIKPFRIEIKKVRAFLRLLELEIKDPDKLEIPASLKEMHKSGGRYRDLQLHQQRIRETVKKNTAITITMSSLLKEGNQQLKKERQDFFQHKNFPAAERKLQEELPDKYNIETIKRFFRDKLDIIAGIIAAGTYHDKELHNIRKKLKDVLYIIKLYRIDIKKPLGFRFWNKAELQHVKGLEDKLGLVNDIHNALVLLQSEKINQFAGKEKKLLLSIRRQLVAEKRKLKTQIIFFLQELPLDRP